MDPIEQHILGAVMISIPGYPDMERLTNSWGEMPTTVLDPRLAGGPIARLKWSRYGVLLHFANARYLAVDEFPKLVVLGGNPNTHASGQLSYYRLLCLSGFFRAIGTTLDVLADEINVLYQFGISPDEITIGKLRHVMSDANRLGKLSVLPERAPLIGAILPLLQSPHHSLYMKWRHVFTHRPRVRYDGRETKMHLPLDPENDQIPTGASHTANFMQGTADVYLTTVLSDVMQIIHAVYVRANADVRSIYRISP